MSVRGKEQNPETWNSSAQDPLLLLAVTSVPCGPRRGWEQAGSKAGAEDVVGGGTGRWRLSRAEQWSEH